MARGFDDDEILGKAYDARLMRRLVRFIVPYRGRVALALLLLFGAALTELLVPYRTCVLASSCFRNVWTGQLKRDWEG